jgi:hypothetical protein
MIQVATFTPRPRPADIALHTLVSLHRSAWGDLLRTGSEEAQKDCDELVRSIALISSRTPEGLRAKGEVVRIRLLDGTMASLIHDGAVGDTALLLSFAADALALTVSEMA